MADESERPGTWRSNVGCEAIDEPCTNRMVPRGPGEAPAAFSHRKRRTSPFFVQCSRPTMLGSAVMGSFSLWEEMLLNHGRAQDLASNTLC